MAFSLLMPSIEYVTVAGSAGGSSRSKDGGVIEMYKPSGHSSSEGSLHMNGIPHRSCASLK